MTRESKPHRQPAQAWSSASVCPHRAWRTVSNTDGGDYRRCRGCGLEEQVSLDSLESRFVGAQDEWYGGDELACLTPFAMALSVDDARYRLEVLRKHARPGKLLEIGPGAGHFAEAAVAAGYDVVTIEDSAVLAEHVRQRGVTVVEERFESAALEPASFDIIVNWHVIEHVLDPREFLSRAATFAAPRATLIVGTPNAASWEHRIAARRSPNYCVPHLRLFTAASLSDVVGEAGWIPTDTFTTDQPDHWLKFAAAHARAVPRRHVGTEPTNTQSAFAVTNIGARRGMQAIRAAGAVTWLPRRVQVRRGRGNELVAIGRRR